MSLKENKQDWEDLSNLDLLWAILADPKKQFGGWNEEEFFSSGEDDINKILDEVKRLGYPSKFHLALDFGCGVGRLTRGLAKNFELCYGVDISEVMINKANNYNQLIKNCKFILNTENKLPMFSDNYFDLIYSSIVLQHIPKKKDIESYIQEFIRILKKDGILIFQLPSYVPLLYRIQPRTKLYHLFRSIGIGKKFLYHTLKLYPFVINFLSESQVKSILIKQNANLLESFLDNKAGKLIQSRTYFVTKN